MVEGADRPAQPPLASSCYRRQMNEESYKIALGRIARTILYEDAVGQMTFTFDFEHIEGTEPKRWRAFLEVKRTLADLPDGESAERSRLLKAIDRTKVWLESRTYAVVLA